MQLRRQSLVPDVNQLEPEAPRELFFAFAFAPFLRLAIDVDAVERLGHGRMKGWPMMHRSRWMTKFREC